MALKQLVEKRNELKAKQDALDKIWDEAKLENGDLDLSRVKSLGDGLTVQMIQEKLKAMNAEAAALVVDIKTLQETEQLAGETKHRERMAGNEGGMHHADPSTKGGETKSFGQMVIDSEEFKEARSKGFSELASKSGKVRMKIEGVSLFANRKAITTIGLGSGTTGVQMPQRIPGIVALPRQELRIRDLMPVTTMTSGNSFDYVRQLARTNNASMQNEGVRKAESNYTWEAKIGTIKTIAHFVKASRQALDDVSWLLNAIESELLYGLLLKEESQILNGDGVGQNLPGLIPTATAYDTGLNVGSDQKLDTIRHALYQARSIGKATFSPDGIVVNPFDLHLMDLIKTEDGAANKGAYIIGDPRRGLDIPMLWGRPVVESDSIDADQFLVGAFGTGARLIDRLSAMIMIAYENEADFVENLATVLAEERLGMAVQREDAFIYGAFPG